MSGPKVLVLDIETSPPLVYDFNAPYPRHGMLGLSQIVQPARMLCWAAKWTGEKETFFGAEWLSDDFVQEMVDLWEEADVLAHYNGKSFDEKHIRREARERGIPPLRPVKTVDLMLHIKKSYRMQSNKLDWVTLTLLGERKLHTDFTLWSKVLNGDTKARDDMERYCRKDTVLTDRLLISERPHIANFPHAGLYLDEQPDGNVEDMCRCGSTDLEKRGHARTDIAVYQQYRCRSCGKWPRGSKRLSGVTVR